MTRERGVTRWIEKGKGILRRVHAQPVPTSEQAQQLLEHTKDQCREVLTHPLVPEFVRHRLTPVIATFTLLPDEEFFSRLANRAVLDAPISQLVQEQGKEVTHKYGGAYYLYPLSSAQCGEVYFRKAYALTAVAENDDLLFTASEEMAHALHPPVEKTPLAQIKNRTHLTPPGKTIEDVKTMMQKRRALEHIPAAVTEADIDVLRHGFGVMFSDSKTQQEIHSIYHTILEETRAGILASALIALHFGRRLSQISDHPFSPEDEFLNGLRALQLAAQRDPVLMGREGAAADFIYSYVFPQARRVVVTSATGKDLTLSISPHDVETGVHKLFRIFGTMPYNSVMATLSKQERLAFLHASEVIGTDYLQKAVTLS